MTQSPLWPAPFPIEGLLAILRTLTGLQVVQKHKPRKVLGLTGGEQAWILASSVSSRELGVDEQRAQTDPDDQTGNTLQFNVCGQRSYVVSFRAESLDAGPSPVSILERVRWGLRTTSAQDALCALGVAVAGFEAIQHLGQSMSDDRGSVVAVLDARFNWAVNFIAPTDDGTTIGTVDGDTQAPGNASTILGTVTVDGDQ